MWFVEIEQIASGIATFLVTFVSGHQNLFYTCGVFDWTIWIQIRFVKLPHKIVFHLHHNLQLGLFSFSYKKSLTSFLFYDFNADIWGLLTAAAPVVPPVKPLIATSWLRTDASVAPNTPCWKQQRFNVSKEEKNKK